MLPIQTYAVTLADPKGFLKLDSLWLATLYVIVVPFTSHRVCTLIVPFPRHRLWNCLLVWSLARICTRSSKNGPNSLLLWGTLDDTI